MRLGLIAGRGELPNEIIRSAEKAGKFLYVARIDGDAHPSETGRKYHIGQFGRISKDFKNHQITHIVFAGYIDHPNLFNIRPDFRTLLNLPGVIKASRKGDDAILRCVLRGFEKDGFNIVSPQHICPHLLIDEGPIGKVSPKKADEIDIKKAIGAALEVGLSDKGQGAVSRQGKVISIEGKAGTDAMLKEIALNGSKKELNDRLGVLAKLLKPGQESRVDLPTIGPRTVMLAAEAGLSGIVLHASNGFIMEREEVVRLADKHDMFVVGLNPDNYS